MPYNQFVSGAITVQFPVAHLVDGGSAPELFQVRGIDSLGAEYIYTKGTVCRLTHRLRLSQVSDVLLGQVLNFFEGTVRGSKTEFTWYDEFAASHTVRLASEVSRTRTGLDTFLVELMLLEEQSLPDIIGMPADGSSGSAPVWIMKFNINGTDYYISDGTISITPWSITTLPWVGAWGRVSEGVTQGVAEFRIADFSCEMLIDPAATPNMETLVTSYPIESSAASLYLWYRGSVNAPVEVFRGYDKTVDIPDETRISAVVEDESIRLRNYVGTKIDRTTYPSADPDDVGKVIPIVLGTVEKLPALAVDAGIMTTLAETINGTVTSITVSDATGLSAGMTLQSDNEQVTIGSIAGDTLTVTRGANGSEYACGHNKGARIWQQKIAFVYLVADHPVDSMSKIYGQVGDVVLDITSICTRYLGAVDNQHASYPGKACVTIPGFITVAQAVSLGVTDTIGISDSISVSDTISLSDPGHYHNAAVSTNEATTTSMPAVAGVYVGGKYGYNPCGGKVMSFPADGARTTASYTVTITPKETYSGVIVKVFVASVEKYSQTYNFVSGSPATFTFSVAGGTANSIDVCTVGSTPAFNVTDCDRTIQLSNNQSSSNQTMIFRTGGASKSGAATKTGTVTLSGNSVANTLVCDKLLVNVVKAYASPLTAMQAVLVAGGSPLTIAQSGTLPGSYALNGAITEYRQCLEWLNMMALQLRSWFRTELGTAKLIVRPDTLTGGTTIPACRVGQDGVKVHSRRKLERADVINKINLLYDRDWTQSGDKAYRQCSKDSDSVSIGIYGECERPELFRCDFITSTTHADSVRDFYLAFYKDRRWIHEFELFLDDMGRAFAEEVTLGFCNNIVGQILEVGYNPGNSNSIDTIRVTVIA